MIIDARMVSARMVTLAEDLARKYMFDMLLLTEKKVLRPCGRRVVIDARTVRHVQGLARECILDVVSLTWWKKYNTLSFKSQGDY